MKRIKLKELLDIPIFHDDQHGTAIITLAALINALDISKKSIKDIKIVVNGAGASAMACTNLFKNNGVSKDNIIMVDRKGVIYRGRDNLNQWKSAFAIETKQLHRFSKLSIFLDLISMSQKELHLSDLLFAITLSSMLLEHWCLESYQFLKKSYFEISPRLNS